MAKLRDTPKNLNTIRLRLLNRGYLLKSDIADFVPCGRKMATTIFNTIQEQVKNDGFENCTNTIQTRRLMHSMGLTEKAIREAAERELLFLEKEKVSAPTETKIN